MERASAAFEVAWPEETMIKKRHWHLHLPDALSRFSTLPSCFTAERKHKSISALATKLLKTTSYEKHLLQQVLSNGICTLQQPDLFPKVCHMWTPKLATQQDQEAIAAFLSQPCLEAQSSNVAMLARGWQVSGGDAIIFAEGHDPSKWKVALAIKHVQVFGLQATLAQLWSIQTMDQYHAKCKVTASNGLIPLGNILFPVPYSHTAKAKTKSLCCCLTSATVEDSRKSLCVQLLFPASQTFKGHGGSSKAKMASSIKKCLKMPCHGKTVLDTPKYTFVY